MSKRVELRGEFADERLEAMRPRQRHVKEDAAERKRAQRKRKRRPKRRAVWK